MKLIGILTFFLHAHWRINRGNFMDQKTIQEIKDADWWQADAPGRFQLIYLPILGFSRLKEQHPSVKYGKIFLLIHNGHAYQFIDKKDSVEFLRYLFNSDQNDPNFIGDLMRKWCNVIKEMEVVYSKLDENLYSADNSELFDMLGEFKELVGRAWGISLIIEGSGIYFEEELFPRIQKECKDVRKEKLLEKIITLTSPKELSFVREEQVDLMEIALQFIENEVDFNISISDLFEKYPGIYKKLSEHQKKYFWIKNTYSNAYVINIDDFLDMVRDILKRNSEKEIKLELKKTFDEIKSLNSRKRKTKKELGLPLDIERKLDLLAMFGWWQDDRKKMNLISNHYLAEFIKEISKRMKIESLDGYGLFMEDIERFLLHGEKVDIDKVRDREKLLLFCVDRKGCQFFQGEEARAYKDEIFSTIRKNEIESKNIGNEIMGMTACKGKKEKIRGKVSLILDINKNSFKEGEILVCSMTRPEFVPLMKKARAIITSEGGITCHAAIVSRELNSFNNR